MENLFIGTHDRFQCLTFIDQLNLLFIQGTTLKGQQGWGVWEVGQSCPTHSEAHFQR